MSILVTGATGFVGGRLVERLLDEGEDVSVLTRDKSGKNLPEEVTIYEGDVLEKESLRGVFEDISTAYYLIHSMGSGGDFKQRDKKAAQNFAEIASDEGVEHTIYLSGLGEDKEGLSDHLQSRRDVESILSNGDYDTTIFRAAVIIGEGSASFDIIRQLAGRLPVMTPPKWVKTECQPIHIDDVIEYLYIAIYNEDLKNDVFEIGGPDIVTYEEMLKQTSIALGRESTIITVPIVSPRLSKYWVYFITDVDKSLIRFLIDGLTNRVVVVDDKIDSIVQIDKTGFVDAIEREVGE